MNLFEKAVKDQLYEAIPRLFLRQWSELDQKWPELKNQARKRDLVCTSIYNHFQGVFQEHPEWCPTIEFIEELTAPINLAQTVVMRKVSEEVKTVAPWA